MLPGIAFSSYKSRFQEPKLEEGFSEVVEVEFKVRTSSFLGSVSLPPDPPATADYSPVHMGDNVFAL